MTLAVKIRELQTARGDPAVLGGAPSRPLPRREKWAFEACFLAGLKKLDEYSEPHRPFKILYSSCMPT
jgi:hypothetical protein